MSSGWSRLPGGVLPPASQLSLPLPSIRRAEEMVTNGCVVDTNKMNVLKPVILLDKLSK